MSRRSSSKHTQFLNKARPHYEAIAKLQGGETCAICGALPRKRRLDIDHDHRKMVVRGLLCHRCNRSLPHWVTEKWLVSAIEYLRRPPIDVDRLE